MVEDGWVFSLLPCCFCFSLGPFCIPPLYYGFLVVFFLWLIYFAFTHKKKVLG